MTTRVTEGARRERPPSFLASRVSRLHRSTLARACIPLTKSEELKRDCSQSRFGVKLLAGRVRHLAKLGGVGKRMVLI